MSLFPQCMMIFFGRCEIALMDIAYCERTVSQNETLICINSSSVLVFMIDFCYMFIFK